jgi:para-aminobenzoate synthetase component 1
LVSLSTGAQGSRHDPYRTWSNGTGGPFEDALATIAAWTAGEVTQALADLDAARARGHWVAGWIAYEAGYALEPCLVGLMPERSGPLLCFGVYAKPMDAACVLARTRVEAEAALDPVVPMVNQAQYGAAFRRVKDYIAAGDCYQINLTFPMSSRLRAGSALGLYGALRARQSVGYGAFADMGAEIRDDGHRIPLLISRSPPSCLSGPMQPGGSKAAR